MRGRAGRITAQNVGFRPARAALDYVDLNVTRAVQAAQLPGVRGYHRRVFSNWADGTYLFWDAVDAPAAECARATMNLHVLTQLGWLGKAGCAVVAAAAGAGATGTTTLTCAALHGATGHRRRRHSQAPLHVALVILHTKPTLGASNDLPARGQA
jgi:hypothetical protein